MLAGMQPHNEVDAKTLLRHSSLFEGVDDARTVGGDSAWKARYQRA